MKLSFIVSAVFLLLSLSFTAKADPLGRCICQALPNNDPEVVLFLDRNTEGHQKPWVKLKGFPTANPPTEESVKVAMDACIDQAKYAGSIGYCLPSFTTP